MILSWSLVVGRWSASAGRRGRLSPRGLCWFLCCYNFAVFRKILTLAIVMAVMCLCRAQAPASQQQQPQVKVNVLNVCTPSPDEQKEIASALAEIPRKPAFSADFEVDRGRSVLDPRANPLAMAGSGAINTDTTAAADFVRIRHDLAGTTYLNVQYSFSRDSHQMVETLVFRVRDPKDLLQVSIEDSASSVTSVITMLSATTPTSRIKLERFGKSSVVLARCSASSEGTPPDQSAFEPLFSSASTLLSSYRALLGARRLIPEELARIGGSPAPAVLRKTTSAPRAK